MVGPSLILLVVTYICQKVFMIVTMGLILYSWVCHIVQSQVSVYSGIICMLFTVP